MAAAIEWEPVQIRLGDLDHWEHNPKLMSKAAARRLLNGTESLGRLATLAVGPAAENGRRPLYDGHQRANIWGAAYGLDLRVWALQSSRLLTEEERKDVVVLTMTARGQFDWDILSAWEVPPEWGLDETTLAEWNADAAALAMFIESEKQEPPPAPEAEIDRAEELREKWGTSPGQLWTLGEFGKLFVGPAELAKIKCDFAIYDPPFDWSWQQQENSLSWARWENCALLGLHYCMPLASRADWLHWWVWDAGVARFGGKGYHPAKTCAIVFAFGEKKRFYPDASNILNEVNYPPQIVRITHPIQGKEHPQEKPSLLCDYIISLYSEENDTVGDPFGGSGSFAVSAFRLKRKYHGSETDPAFCAVILERLSKLGVNCVAEPDAGYDSQQAGTAASPS